MSQCSRCTTNVVPGAFFCHECGLMLRAYCRACRLPLPEHSRFCHSCGLSVESSPEHKLKSQSSTNRDRPSPVKNRSPSLELRNEGERKLVSILFADITGFTAMSEKMDPEKVTDIMNHCFEALGQCVDQLDGHIDKFMGDCIMALFGAPIAHENDPELAVTCALSMLEELEKFNKKNDLQLGMSIGINSGVVIAGHVGTETKREYTVMGDAVNLAQRLESAAQANQILVSKEIQRSTNQKFKFEELPSIHVKGKDQAVEVFSVLGRAEEHSARSGPICEAPQRFIGRAKELGLAKTALNQVQSGKTQVLGLCGEAGIGKTRLAYEIMQHTRNQSILCLEARCQVLQKDTAFFLLRKFVEDTLSKCSEQRTKKKALKDLKLDSVSEELILSEILGDKKAANASQNLSAEQKKRALFLAVKRLILKICKERPLALFFEDLHWIDSLSKEFLNHLIQSMKTQPCLLVLSFRPEFSHDWFALPHFSSLNIEAFSLEECLEMVRALLGTAKAPRILEDLIDKRSDGNPLYVEEIVKSLIDAGALEKVGSGWSVNEGILLRSEIPSTLRGLIASRLDRLPPEEKTDLQVASVIGRNFELEVLKESSDDAHRIESSIESWIKRDLVYETTSESGGLSYAFKHAMTQEVAFESILKKKRRGIHEKVANAIERVFSNRHPDLFESQIEALAYHFSKAEISEKAILYLSRAGEKLYQAFACEEAVSKIQSAIQLQEEEQKSSPHYEATLSRLYHLLTQPLFLMHEFKEAEKVQRKLLLLSETQNDLAKQAKCYRVLGDATRLQGRTEEALDFLRKGIECAVQAGNEEEKLKTYKAFGNALKKVNETEMALDYLHQARSGGEKLKDEKLVVDCLNDIAAALLTRNDPKQKDLENAERHLTECIRISKERADLASIRTSATLNLGVVHYHRRDFKKAQKHFEESFEVSEQIGDMRNLMISKHNIGEVQKELGDYWAALQSFEQARNWAEELENYTERINNQILVGYMRTKTGDFEQGQKELYEMATLAEELNLNHLLMDCHQYLARSFEDSDQIEKALPHLEQAQEIALRLQLKGPIGDLRARIKALESKKKLNKQKQKIKA